MSGGSEKAGVTSSKYKLGDDLIGWADLTHAQCASFQPFGMLYFHSTPSLETIEMMTKQSLSCGFTQSVELTGLRTVQAKFTCQFGELLLEVRLPWSTRNHLQPFLRET